MGIEALASVCGLVGTALGWIVRSAFVAGRKESGIAGTVEHHGKKLEEHGRRLDEHDDWIAEMPEKYVPRPEVERALGSIEQSQRESKQLLLHLVTKQAIEAGIS